MRHFRWILLFVPILIVYGWNKLDDYFYERPRAIYPAGSVIKDPRDPGMFGPCNNFPKELGEHDWGMKGDVSIIAFPEESAAYFKYQGFALRVVNRTTAVASFRACDSLLYIVCEAMDKAGAWHELESPPKPICGNSYHHVFLKANQYWEFSARLCSGSIKTKLRFRLVRDNEFPVIYSNEFDGEIAAVQLKDDGRDK